MARGPCLPLCPRPLAYLDGGRGDLDVVEPTQGAFPVDEVGGCQLVQGLQRDPRAVPGSPGRLCPPAQLALVHKNGQGLFSWGGGTHDAFGGLLGSPIPLVGCISPAVFIFSPPSLTSQRGSQQEVGPIFFDEAVGDLLGAGPASQQTDVADEFGGQGKGQAEEVFPLQGQIIHLPASKLSVGE